MVVRQRGAEIVILSYGMMVVRQRGAEIGILSYGIMVVRHSELLITDGRTFAILESPS